ncbi:MAG: YidC/Oxa1 family membrane protein insertase, partial [Clostridia bacterium]|nr:YidC/Oxa1 family membrane protein insertase [Clostridia bacterium]
GVSFGPIADLSQPDGLIRLGALSINFLPILMTLINVVSSTLYLKGFPLKMKIQLYGMALLFLVLLYDSPAGLVFYWTLNNTYSLGKTLVNRIPHGGKILSAVLGALGAVCALFSGKLFGGEYRSVLVPLGVILMLPLFFVLLKTLLPKSKRTKTPKANTGMYVCGALFLTVLTGLLIPSTFIAASPLEYVDVFYFYHPVWYIVRTGCMAAGTFMVWMSVFYWLMSPKGKVILSRLVWVLSAVMLVNYMFFGTDLGVLTSALKYENGLSFASAELILNSVVVLVLAVVMILIHIRWPRPAGAILLSGAIVLSAMSGLHIGNVVKTVKDVTFYSSSDKGSPQFTLSTTENNVVVIMLDRAMAQYVPYIMNEKPELAEQFDGFTAYMNTLSLGGSTIFGAPALMGGYEYSPVELNRRDEENMTDKYNEALKVLPVLFDNNGYDVTVCDAPLANFMSIPDMSIYDEYPQINTFLTQGYFGNIESREAVVDNREHNFFWFSLMKTLPLVMQNAIYDNGVYHADAGQEAAGTHAATASTLVAQNMYNKSKAVGLDSTFMDCYNVLLELPNMTKVEEKDNGSFFFLANKITHSPALLQLPEYEPKGFVNNTEYDEEHADRFTVDGETLDIWNEIQMSHYHVNMAAFMQLGNWFDHLREQGVYDNTKIILVADHGFWLSHQQALYYGEDWTTDTARYYPLFMVKDFNSTGFTMSDEFMTNADTASIAVRDVIDEAVNPFTGNPISDKDKYENDQYVILSEQWEPELNDGTTYVPSAWAKVSGDRLNMENWVIYEEETVLPPGIEP